MLAPRSPNCAGTPNGTHSASLRTCSRCVTDARRTNARRWPTLNSPQRVRTNLARRPFDANVSSLRRGRGRQGASGPRLRDFLSPPTLPSRWPLRQPGLLRLPRPGRPTTTFSRPADSIPAVSIMSAEPGDSPPRREGQRGPVRRCRPQAAGARDRQREGRRRLRVPPRGSRRRQCHWRRLDDSRPEEKPLRRCGRTGRSPAIVFRLPEHNERPVTLHLIKLCVGCDRSRTWRTGSGKSSGSAARTGRRASTCTGPAWCPSVPTN